MPSSNIDYIDLSLWAQAHGLEEAYALSHAIFRQRGEDALRGDGEPGSDVQGLMTSAEENAFVQRLVGGASGLGTRGLRTVGLWRHAPRRLPPHPRPYPPRQPRERSRGERPRAAAS